VALGKKGGKARVDSLTAKKRSEIAKKAAAIRTRALDILDREVAQIRLEMSTLLSRWK
jgi:hypothetical protein